MESATRLKVLRTMELLKKTSKWKLTMLSKKLSLKRQRILVGSEENPSDQDLESARDRDQGSVRDHDLSPKNEEGHVRGPKKGKDLEIGKDRGRGPKTVKDRGQTQENGKEHVPDQKIGNALPDRRVKEDDKDLDLGLEKIESNDLDRERGKGHDLEIVEDVRLRNPDLEKTAKDDQKRHGDLDHVTVGDLGDTPPPLPRVQLHLEISIPLPILAFLLE